MMTMIVAGAFQVLSTADHPVPCPSDLRYQEASRFAPPFLDTRRKPTEFGIIALLNPGLGFRV